MMPRSSGLASRQDRPHQTFSDPGLRELIGLLRDGNPRTRAEIAREIGIARSTLASRLDVLSDTGLVVPGRAAASGGGRPPSTFVFNPDARLVLAVHISAAIVRMALTDLSGTFKVFRCLPGAGKQPPRQTLTAVLAAGWEMLTSIGRGPDELAGIGIGLSAIIDENGRPVGSELLPAWAGFDVSGFINAACSVPVVVESEVHLSAIYERLLRWPEHTDLLYVHLEEHSVRAAVFSGGQLQRGSRGAAGILAPAGDPGSDSCVCGATAPSPSCYRGITSDSMYSRETGRRLGGLLAAAVTILNPSVIVLDGNGDDAGDSFLAGIREAVYQRCQPRATRGLTITLTTAGGENAVLSGISQLMTQQFLVGSCRQSPEQAARKHGPARYRT